ncbi:hypothetical protein Aglo03_07610 [Actinokineospora globicatena]|uniref:Uncharacterized protein n=1 Tax=Actinokineospora globicatena TaxID=103729 RepID=A0A9W6V547_9PSEU|nr:hypothetical protein Aglo03_07610 [Actinokineospora globicatena]
MATTARAMATSNVTTAAAAQTTALHANAHAAVEGRNRSWTSAETTARTAGAITSTHAQWTRTAIGLPQNPEAQSPQTTQRQGV